MNKSKTITTLWILSATVVVCTLLLYWLVPQVIYRWVWVLLIYFIAITMASYLVVQRIASRKRDNFMAAYFSAMLARLFLSIIVASVFILLDRSEVLLFAINFVVLYLLFLGFELYGIMSNLRHHFKKGPADLDDTHERQV